MPTPALQIGDVVVIRDGYGFSDRLVGQPAVVAEPPPAMRPRAGIPTPPGYVFIRRDGFAGWTPTCALVRVEVAS